MLYSESLLSDSSSDPLYGSLTSLSLTDTSKSRTAEVSSEGFNPFTHYFSKAHETGSANGECCDPIKSVKALTHDIIPQRLAGLRCTRQFVVNESDGYYHHGRRVQEKLGASDEGFENWRGLQRGWEDFPAVLLQSPSPHDHLPMGEMVEASATLRWIREGLRPTGLTLDDVIIFDTYPMVTQELLERVDRADWPELLADAFRLTLEGLRRVRVQILISCQCSTNSTIEPWGMLDDPIARALCSSVSGAQSGLVRGVEMGHQMHVVEGMHPHYVVKHRRELNGVLQKLFLQIFSPFGEWKSHRETTRQGLQTAATVMVGLVKMLQLQLALYQRLSSQAEAEGIEGPVDVGRVEELGRLVNGWEHELGQWK